MMYLVRACDLGEALYKTGWFFRVSRRPESNELYLDVRATIICFGGFAVTNLERGARSCL